MTNSYRLLTLYFLLLSFLFSCEPTISENQTTDWPEIQQEAKPWTRWWWHGSSVSKEGITAELEAFKAAGIGGLEITPIYGEKGGEEAFISYLSPEWMDMLVYTLQEAKRLDLGVDMATGTGWPFGGPWVSEDDASKYLTHKVYELNEGETLNEPVYFLQESFVRQVHNQGVQAKDLNQPISENENLQQLAIDQVRFENPLPLQSLMAYSDEGEIIDLTNRVSTEGELDWTAPAGSWTLYAVFQGWHGKMVERAAPGGEGNVIDHFSAEAIQNYLANFDRAFSESDISYLRAFFNDSYEVDDARGQANSTPNLLEEFQKRRGYDLREHWPTLFGELESENSHRVLSDFRETISELLLETFTIEWSKWAKDKGKIIRNQSHGSPANILDLYAASDIPETEGTDLVRIKFATSAGHVTGKQLISSESATWLDEHFQSNLADLKENLDRYFVGGVNHVFYHGTCYSPPESEWPGRLFYAAIHANPRNSLWHDFPALNEYISRVQSFLQKGVAHNDILLYFPAYDRYATPTRELLDHFDGHGPSLEGTPFDNIAKMLLKDGYTFDYISDKQIQGLAFDEKGIQTGGAHYQTIVLPQGQYIPSETLGKLVDLAKNGATIIVHQALPVSVPGLGNYEERMRGFQELVGQLDFQPLNSNIQEAKLGNGRFLLGENIQNLLSQAKIHRESLVDVGLNFTKRSFPDGQVCYFITNWSSEKVDGWVQIESDNQEWVLFDPVTGKKGQAKIRKNQDGKTEVYLQMARGSAYILLNIASDNFPSWQYYQPEGNPTKWSGTWNLEFIKGGPELPDAMSMDSLILWTSMNGEEYQNFSGTARYQSEFPMPQGGADAFQIDLGEVYESANILLNGKQITTLLGPDYQLILPKESLKETNVISIEVSNLMANRIAWMDKNDLPWKQFYNINISARRPENRGKNGLFDASKWEIQPSGLSGPVSIQPMKLF